MAGQMELLECPSCASLFQVHPARVEGAGIVRCKPCGCIFNASGHARWALPSSEAEPVQEPAAKRESELASSDASLFEKQPSRWRAGLGSGALAVAMAGALLLQWAIARPSQASEAWSGAEMASQWACSIAGCSLNWPSGASSTSLDGASIEEGEGGMLIFTASARSSGAAKIRAPKLVLELRGESGNVLAKRAFSPQEWLGKSTLAGGEEREVELFFAPFPERIAQFRASLSASDR